MGGLRPVDWIADVVRAWAGGDIRRLGPLTMNVQEGLSSYPLLLARSVR